MNAEQEIPQEPSSKLHIFILGIAILIVIILGIYFFTSEKEEVPTTKEAAAPVTTVTLEAPSIPWQMCHGTAQHTGQSAYRGSQTGTLKWKYQYYEPAAGEKIPNPPKSFAISSDGNIYTSAIGTLLAFSSEGELLWSVEGLGRGEGGAVALSPDESKSRQPNQPHYAER